MADAADRLLGQPLFGGYVITRKIGAGGMGAVYLVENPELGKKLAIKVLLPDRSTSATATARFLAEARGASAINHRNIISILDASQLEDGRHYILMEYLEGTTLRRYARGVGPMPVDVTLAVLAQVCSGLQAAHDRGIIHRDLKPSNIFVSPQPDNPYFAKILDFGIAKLEDPSLAGEVHTKSQTVAGTPNYMSPEQARALRDVDHRTDIYSVGVLAYELLTGRLPYKAKSVGDLVFQQSSTTPVRARELRKDLPRGWDELIHKAIALDPKDRPQSAQEFARRMMIATPRGEEIARATASLLFTALSESTSTPPAPRRNGSEDDDACPLSRTLSVPVENFGPEEMERWRQRSTGVRSGSRRLSGTGLRTKSTFGLVGSQVPAPRSRRVQAFAVASIALVLALAVAAVRAAQPGADAPQAAKSVERPVKRGEPVVVEMPVEAFGPKPAPPQVEARVEEPPPPEKEVRRSPRRVRRTKHAPKPPPAAEPKNAAATADNPDDLFRDRN